MALYLVPCSCPTVTGEICRRACIDICEKLRVGESRMVSLAFYARSLATGDRLILGSSLSELKAGKIACINGCGMECATKIMQALGVQPRHSIRLLEEIPGIKVKGNLSEITPDDVKPAAEFILGKISS